MSIILLNLPDLQTVLAFENFEDDLLDFLSIAFGRGLLCLGIGVGLWLCQFDQHIR
jgi:hypothetical protein